MLHHHGLVRVVMRGPCPVDAPEWPVVQRACVRALVAMSRMAAFLLMGLLLVCVPLRLCHAGEMVHPATAWAQGLPCAESSRSLPSGSCSKTGSGIEVRAGLVDMDSVRPGTSFYRTQNGDSGQGVGPVWSQPLVVSLVTMVLLSSLMLAVAGYIRHVNVRLRTAVQQLRHSEEHHRLLADNASDVIWTVDMEGRFTYVSPSVKRLRGFSAREALSQSMEEAFMPESAALVRQAMERNLTCLRQGLPVSDFRGELAQPCKDGSTVWAELSMSGMLNASGRFVGFLGVTRDITERRRTQEKMERMAQYDLLTQLPNRALLMDRLEQAMTRHQRVLNQHSLPSADAPRLALMFVDLDHFKEANDEHGHAVGDALLQMVARRMTDCVRASDTVARIGGDEFIVLLPDVFGVQAALTVAENIRLSLSRPYDIVPDGGKPLSLHISSSIGLALYSDHARSMGELMSVADEAMYQAKQSGRNRVQIASVTSREAVEQAEAGLSLF